ncbi:6-phosphogluconolactonase [Toxocara canis]|uniref:6-phosphogluconolactonase n=2 Tax=Toxocara canis TaxID=6265 RepID=A0A0B2W1F3_TOXCA|nr:6-phosphogluconolactonase [Toxocara canis]VDM40447.1 unnamed protein product [Toxocara canis]
MVNPTIVVGESSENLQHKISEYIEEIIKNSLQEKKCATVGLSGGSMPKMVAPLLANMHLVQWGQVRFFAADERMEPITDPESNTGAYLSLLPPSFKQSFLEVGPINDTAKCAINYSELLRNCEPAIEDGWPVFDLLLLGIGPDGHTCSLFPDHPLLKNETDWVAAIEDSPKPPPRRITLTLPVLNHARHVAFICTGEGKAEVIRLIIKDQDKRLPAALVQPISGTLHWFLDEGAASKL